MELSYLLFGIVSCWQINPQRKCVSVGRRKMKLEVCRKQTAVMSKIFYSVCAHLSGCSCSCSCVCDGAVLFIWCLSNHSMIQMISTLTSIDQSEFSWHEMNTPSLYSAPSVSAHTHTHISLFVPSSVFLIDTSRLRTVFKEAVSYHKSEAAFV